METVTVRFVGGPADGTAGELPAAPGGRPPQRWVLSTRDDAFDVPGADHLYELRPEQTSDGIWTLTFVRTDPVGMTE
ncbi:hypothetical protein I0C86_35555 [Plantactinospora sp. S1510]|uniref:Uncharacterized protein n=1 Tax=Plantactinospora alkalitolerans TaxID=2789879 RepID=A0ABS0H6W3_9ACTN|nr:hypothetical protein [Plantactinospora alkalitolerans]MBF9134212.1 hypothetical protein [Plantactinospora alkalitolerans]